MISHNNYCIIDFETDSLNPNKNQPISIGAVMIDGRKLTVCDGGTFYSLIKRIPDDQVDLYNLNKLEQKALDKNKIQIKDIEQAPPLKKVWADFVNWFNYFNPTKDHWNAAILCGHNHPYDRAILNRIQKGHLAGEIVISKKLLGTTKLKKASNDELAEEYKTLLAYKEPWGFGPDNLYYPSMSIDTYPLMHCLFENSRDPDKLNLDALLNFFGLKLKHNSHHALVDVLYTAELLVRYLGLLRKVYRDTVFDTDNITVLPIDSILSKIFTTSDKTEECPFE